MCCKGPSPQHNRVIIASAILFPLEFVQWILNIAVVVIWAGLTAATVGTTVNTGSSSGRMLSSMLSDIPMLPDLVAPVVDAHLSLPALSGRQLALHDPCSYGAECGAATLGLGCINNICQDITCVIGVQGDEKCKAFLSGYSGVGSGGNILKCTALAGLAGAPAMGTCQFNIPESCKELSIDFNKQDLNNPSLNNDQITQDVTGLAVAAWLSTVLNFLMFVGLCSILCCCGCARTNAASCWWWYLTIIATLAAGILIYPAVIMAGLTNKLGLAKECIGDLVNLGGVNLPSTTTSIVDSVHTFITVITVLIFITLFLRLAVAVLLWFCTPSAQKLAGQDGVQMQSGNYSAGYAQGGGPITRAGV